ncbi:hypothetical protein [Flavobacterium sp. CSZ]|uniref:hypothetical protein n=1 Tax=Flavobacterium sp. CSZ TaxID=2783791 RepID=UPI001889E192|nr:hypothetical protein [Flavobacterium sp. CSZ]MBF4486773.1 hypothetical protein [Flavobacterium sp. CSZ]
MTEIELLNIIKKKELPKDELDDFWDNFFGFLPLFIFIILSKSNIAFLIVNLILIFYTFYSKFNEKKLITIVTPLNEAENISLIENIAEEQQWKTKTKQNALYEFYIPFLFNQPGHKLTLIARDNAILLNLRNIGSTKGRMPYLFGIDTLKERKIIGLINSTEHKIYSK